MSLGKLELVMHRVLLEMGQGWKPYAHHATVNMGPKDKGLMADVEIGTPIPLNAIELGLSDRVMAVRVEGANFHTKNAIPHITVAVAPGAKPYESNKISEWTPMTPLPLDATLQEVEHNGAVSYTAAVLTEDSKRRLLDALADKIPVEEKL